MRLIISTMAYNYNCRMINYSLKSNLSLSRKAMIITSKFSGFHIFDFDLYSEEKRIFQMNQKMKR